MIKKLLNEYHYPKVVVEKVKENVYILADEVNGIGFKSCDKIALKSGVKKNDPNRLKSFIEYFLNEEALNGNTEENKEVFSHIIEETNTINNMEIVGDDGKPLTKEEQDKAKIS